MIKRHSAPNWQTTFFLLYFPFNSFTKYPYEKSLNSRINHDNLLLGLLSLGESLLGRRLLRKLLRERDELWLSGQELAQHLWNIEALEFNS